VIGRRVWSGRKLAPEKVEEVFMGNVLPAGTRPRRPARQAAAWRRVNPMATGATTVNKVLRFRHEGDHGWAHDIITAGFR